MKPNSVYEAMRLDVAANSVILRGIVLPFATFTSSATEFQVSTEKWVLFSCSNIQRNFVHGFFYFELVLMFFVRRVSLHLFDGCHWFFGGFYDCRCLCYMLFFRPFLPFSALFGERQSSCRLVWSQQKMGGLGNGCCFFDACLTLFPHSFHYVDVGCHCIVSLVMRMPLFFCRFLFIAFSIFLFYAIFVRQWMCCIACYVLCCLCLWLFWHFFTVENGKRKVQTFTFAYIKLWKTND